MKITSAIVGMALGLSAIVALQTVTRDSRAQQPATITVASAEAAVERTVVSGGGTFAGACETTRSPEDIGKVCSRFIEERDGVRAYLIGRTFSEFSTWVFVGRVADGWSTITTAPLDFHDLSMTIPWP